jgi:hypothetical protein
VTCEQSVNIQEQNQSAAAGISRGICASMQPVMQTYPFSASMFALA